MQNVMNGQAAATTAAPTYTQEGQLAAFKASLNGLLASSDVITNDEYQAAAANIARCQSLATLQKWYRNCVREIATREEALPLQEVVQYATAAQTSEVQSLAQHSALTTGERTRALLWLQRLDQAGTTALIGELWGTILHRTGKRAAGPEQFGTADFYPTAA